MSTHIQSQISSKEYFDIRQAQSYIRRQPRFKPLKIDETTRSYRLRLRSPDSNVFEYKIEPFGDGVKAHIGIRYDSFYYHYSTKHYSTVKV